MNEYSEKVVRDPIYGYIGLTKEQLAIISLPVFQRLRRISQLSLAVFTYPGANHTRFSHSLGVMELARRVANHLKSNGIIDDSYYEALIWAGLLHDIGHFPFSHAFEPAAAHFVEREDRTWRDVHVRWGKKIISNPEFGITNIIEHEIFEKVLKLIDKEDKSSPKILIDTMTGMFSIDRLDYLRRDAYHAGTPEYAIIDMDRIVTSQILYKNGTIPVFKEKARYALEGVILSYFYMYRAIYYHHTVRSAFLLFQDILWDAFQNKVFHEINFDDYDYWINFDDNRCLTMLSESVELKERLDSLLTRKLPKIIREKDILKIYYGRIIRLCQPGSYQDRIKIERKLLEKLKKKWENLKVLFLDSPILNPYPQPLTGEYPFLWNGLNDTEPYIFHEGADYLTHLEKSSEQARIYVNSVWSSNPERKRFVSDLNDALLKIKEPVIKGGGYEMAD